MDLNFVGKNFGWKVRVWISNLIHPLNCFLLAVLRLIGCCSAYESRGLHSIRLKFFMHCKFIGTYDESFCFY